METLELHSNSLRKLMVWLGSEVPPQITIITMGLCGSFRGWIRESFKACINRNKGSKLDWFRRQLLPWIKCNFIKFLDWISSKQMDWITVGNLLWIRPWIHKIPARISGRTLQFLASMKGKILDIFRCKIKALWCSKTVGQLGSFQPWLRR